MKPIEKTKFPIRVKPVVVKRVRKAVDPKGNLAAPVNRNLLASKRKGLGSQSKKRVVKKQRVRPAIKKPAMQPNAIAQTGK